MEGDTISFLLLLIPALSEPDTARMISRQAVKMAFYGTAGRFQGKQVR
jgi:hypothetical protein